MILWNIIYKTFYVINSSITAIDLVYIYRQELQHKDKHFKKMSYFINKLLFCSHLTIIYKGNLYIIIGNHFIISWNQTFSNQKQ